MEKQLDGLVAELGDTIGRFIVTVGSVPDEDAATVDQTVREVAAHMRQAGALMVEPIAGPLIVLEADGGTLRRLALDPRIVCIQRDTPEGPTN